MKIQLVTPAPRRSLKGNRVTAVRWARILRQLGHRPTIEESWDGEPCDLLVALHARRSRPSIECFHRRRGELPLIVTLTGTDLYGDLRSDPEVRETLGWADRLIVLQEQGVEELPSELRQKTRVIYQSAVASRARIGKSRRTFDVCVVGHLRPVKDPFRAALAARLLPAESRLRVLHAGSALEPEMVRRAKVEMAVNPRYRWLGELQPWRVRQLLLRSHAMVVSSEMEGGANVIAEAIVAALPVVASRIPGSIGMLGEDHPAYFDVGDTEALADLLRRCEIDPAFLADLEARSRRLAPRFAPERETEAWRDLLAELS